MMVVIEMNMDVVFTSVLSFLSNAKKKFIKRDNYKFEKKDVKMRHTNTHTHRYTQDHTPTHLYRYTQTKTHDIVEILFV